MTTEQIIPAEFVKWIYIHLLLWNSPFKVLGVLISKYKKIELPTV
jgi:hypothetical protein